MNLQELRYLVAVAEQRHFGRAAEACNVSQPTLSSQIRKLEEELGVTLIERTNKRVVMTPVGSQILAHAQRALAEAAQMEAVARAARDPLVGPLKLGVIPTLAPYLMPMILKPLRQAYPGLAIELWEDQTRLLIEGLRNHRLDAALLATPPEAPEITEIALFNEPLLAALPPDHRLAGEETVTEEALADELLVLADGHCLANHALAACGTRRGPARSGLQGGDAGRDPGNAGEPGGCRLREHADSRPGRGLAGSARHRPSPSRRQFLPDHPPGQPPRIPAPPSPACARKSDPPGHPAARAQSAAFRGGLLVRIRPLAR